MRKYFYGKSRKKVQEKLASALQVQKQGVLVATPQQTVAHFLIDWLELTRKHSTRPRTYERYADDGYLLTRLAGLQQVDMSRLNSLLVRREEGPVGEDG